MKDKDLEETQNRLEEIKNKSRIFDSGAVRDSSSGKPNVHDMQGYTLLRFGYHMELGEQNYGSGNYLKGIPDEVAMESLARHYAKERAGYTDEDHKAAMIFNLQILMLNERDRGIKEDHYYNKKNKKSE